MFGKYALVVYSFFLYMVERHSGHDTPENSIARRIPTVDSFLDIHDAEQAIDEALLEVFKFVHIANMWWTANNPRLGGAKPRDLWVSDPFVSPEARDAVMNAAFTILTFTPEPGYAGLVEHTPDVRDSRLTRAGKTIGRIAADITVR